MFHLYPRENVSKPLLSNVFGRYRNEMLGYNGLKVYCLIKLVKTLVKLIAGIFLRLCPLIH